MINYINDSVVPRRLLFATALLAVAFVLSHASNASAQSPVTTNGGTIGKIPKWTTSTLLGDSVITESAAGNVGIGTTNPLYKLDIFGGVASQLHLTSNGTSNGLYLFANGGDAYYLGGASFDGAQWIAKSSVASVFAEANGQFVFYNNSGLTAGNGFAPTERMRLDYGGRLGIGTPTPAYLLDVAGSTNTPFRVRDSADREYFSTTTRTGTFGTAPVVNLASSRLIIDGSGPDGNNDTILRRLVNSLIFNPSDHPNFPGAFMVRQVGGSSILYVDQNANGNIGIGTTTPTAKLHVIGDGKVTGNLTVDGNIAAKYQDVAEWVPASEQIATGTVVVLDSTRSNQVISSTQAYDTRVAGVISEKPGIALGERGDNKVLVATTGRVRIKVDASRGPIHIGDLLVTSDIPGMAMKSEPVSIGGVQIHRPGTLIGKALEPLAKGQGEILVLLSLQ